MHDRITIIDARPEHLAEIVTIYNKALIARTATFETNPKSEIEITNWLGEEVALQVALVDQEVAGFAKVSNYRDRDCYSGVREYSVYVADDFQSKGVGSLLIKTLISKSKKAGVWKLIARIFSENTASIELAQKVGFRIVGTYMKHGKLDGVWKDCVVVELAL